MQSNGTHKPIATDPITWAVAAHILRTGLDRNAVYALASTIETGDEIRGNALTQAMTQLKAQEREES